jgi:hypothetical protein
MRLRTTLIAVVVIGVLYLLLQGFLIRDFVMM